MIRVTIYDSSSIFTGGLVNLIAGCSEFKLIGTFLAANGEPSWLTDLFVLDAEIETGTAAPELVSRLASLAPVLLLARRGIDPRILESLMAAGAGGFVDTRAMPTTFVEAMRLVAFGTTFKDPEFDVDQAAPPAQQVPGLSDREQQVLTLIARGMTHHQIANAIKISRHTVDTYVKRIRSKLNLGNKAELTRVAVLRSMSS